LPGAGPRDVLAALSTASRFADEVRHHGFPQQIGRQQPFGKYEVVEALHVELGAERFFGGGADFAKARVAIE
jgi:hypothetical protein